MIFIEYPYVCDKEEIKSIMEKKNISFETTKIKLPTDYTDLPQKYGAESNEHRAMKKAVIELLKNMGETNPQIEYGYIDVYSEKYQLAVEVGDTPVNRISHHLARPYVKNLLTIDFEDSNSDYEVIEFRKKEPRQRKPVEFNFKEIMLRGIDYS